MKLASLIAALILLVGCTSAPAPASLRTSCEALRSVLTDFGEAAPDAGRYAEFLTKLKAISDAGDASTREAFAPLLAAFEKGSTGAQESLGESATAIMKLMVACSAAGASMASPTPTPTTAGPVTVPAASCGLVADGVVEAILADTGRSAVKAASARSGVGPWLVALRLRNDDVGVWVVDSIIDPASILSADPTAAAVSGWGMAGVGEYGSVEAVAAARSCVA